MRCHSRRYITWVFIQDSCFVRCFLLLKGLPTSNLFIFAPLPNSFVYGITNKLSSRATHLISLILYISQFLHPTLYIPYLLCFPLPLSSTPCVFQSLFPNLCFHSLCFSLFVFPTSYISISLFCVFHFLSPTSCIFCFLCLLFLIFSTPCISFSLCILFFVSPTSCISISRHGSWQVLRVRSHRYYLSLASDNPMAKFRPRHLLSNHACRVSNTFHCLLMQRRDIFALCDPRADTCDLKVN